MEESKMSLLSGFNVTLPQLDLLGQAAMAAFAGGAIPAGWNVVTPQQLGIASQYRDGNYFTNNGATAIVLQQGSTWIVSFRGTDGLDDVLQYPKLVFGTYINHFQPLLSAVASNAPNDTSFYFTGASLGGGATNLMADIAASQYGGKFASSHFVAFASPNISDAIGILNVGFENDPIYKAVDIYNDFPSSLDNLVLATSQYMQGNYDGLLPPDDYAHNAALAFDAFDRLQSSVFFNQMTPDSVVIFDAFSGTVQDITPGRENTGVFYLGENVADVIVGRNGDDNIEGFAGDDTLSGGPGNDYLNGGTGFDVAVFSGSKNQYIINQQSTSQYLVTGPDDADTVVNVEGLRFLDTVVLLDANGAIDLEATVQSVYQAMTSVLPADSTLSNLISFSTAQYGWALNVGVLDPVAAMGEALGLGLCESAGFFISSFGPAALQNDATFVSKAYEQAFGFLPSQAQTTHFLDQLHYFDSFYTAFGTYGTDPARIDLLARGAVYGQMLGISAELDLLV
jgi:RTX calcium-binding nonapeptide repeat (4 copies)